MGLLERFLRWRRPPRLDLNGDSWKYPVNISVPCHRLDDPEIVRMGKSVIADWCEEHLEGRYMVEIAYPTFIENETYSGSYRIFFSNDRDAFNFKMRWL